MEDGVVARRRRIFLRVYSCFLNEKYDFQTFLKIGTHLKLTVGMRPKSVTVGTLGRVPSRFTVGTRPKSVYSWDASQVGLQL